MFGPIALLMAFFIFATSIVHIVAELEPNPNSTWPTHSYISAPDFHPPVLDITAPEQASQDGYLFFSPGGPKASEQSPLIMTSSGDLIWNGPALFTFNFGVQIYRGEPVLLAWNGSRFPEPIGRGHGNVYLWNKHYEQIANVSLPGDFVEYNGMTFPSNIDLHEQVITERGTMVVLANNVTRADLSSVGGPSDGWVVEGQIYEIDVATNEVLFVWKSLQHLDVLPFTDSLYPLGSEGFDGTSRAKAWGYFHNNAVTTFRDGYILSSRYFCSVIAIDHDGSVVWVLQGRDGGDFELMGGDASNFCYQHHVRVREEVVDRKNGNVTGLAITMHDNHNCPIDKNNVPTSGKAFDINVTNRTALMTHRYLNQSGLVYGTA